MFTAISKPIGFDSGPDSCSQWLSLKQPLRICCEAVKFASRHKPGDPDLAEAAVRELGPGLFQIRQSGKTVEGAVDDVEVGRRDVSAPALEVIHKGNAPFWGQKRPQ